MAVDIDDFDDKWAKSKVKFNIFFDILIYFSEFERKIGLSVDNRRDYSERIFLSKKKNLVCKKAH